MWFYSVQMGTGKVGGKTVFMTYGMSLWASLLFCETLRLCCVRIVILDRLDYCANTKNFESMVA